MPNGLKFQDLFERSLMRTEPQPYALDLETWLGSLSNSALAYVANRALRRERYTDADGVRRPHTWASRGEAIAAVLDWDARKDLGVVEDRLSHDTLARWMDSDFTRPPGVAAGPGEVEWTARHFSMWRGSIGRDGPDGDASPTEKTVSAVELESPEA